MATPSDGTCFRFATWNVDQFGNDDRRWAFLEDVGADVAALQEVAGREIPQLKERSSPGPIVFSQDVYPDANYRWIGCALLFSAGTSIEDVGVLDALPKPQRGLWARVSLPRGGRMTVVSWHTPNAAKDGRETKMAAYREMSDWLTAQTGAVVLGADLNTWTDPVDLVKPAADDDYLEESAFVGADPPHGMIDAYRQAQDRQGRLESLRETNPEGPLAVSYELDSGARHRMDRIFVSDELEAVEADYLFDGARAAGSDHGLHWANLCRSEPPSAGQQANRGGPTP